MRAASVIFLCALIGSCSGVRRQSEGIRGDGASFFYRPEHYAALGGCESGGGEGSPRTSAGRDGPGHWNSLGLCHFLAGAYAKAVFFFDMALAKADGASKAGPLNNLGVVHARLGRHLRAHSYFLRASKADPALLVAGVNLAHTYINFHHYAEARRVLDGYVRRHATEDVLRRALERAAPKGGGR